MRAKLLAASPGASRPRLVLLVVAAVLALACTGLVVARAFVPGVLPSSWTAPDKTADQITDVTIAARSAVQTFMTADYRTIDADLKKLRAQATGTFAEEVDHDGVALAARARELRAVSEGVVLKVGIGKLTPKTAIVDLGATKHETRGVAATGETQGKTTQYYYKYVFQVTLTEVGSRWLVSKLEVVQTQ